MALVVNRKEEKRMSRLDAKTKELTAIAASVAGNCIPCLKYDFNEAVKENCTKREIE